MIKEWKSFWNEFRSRVTFILHLHDNTKTAQPKAFKLAWFSKFVFSSHNTRTKCLIIAKTGNELIPEWFVRDQMSFRYHVNKYREIYGDWMNSFQNKGHSGIMWIALKRIICTKSTDSINDSIRGQIDTATVVRCTTLTLHGKRDTHLQDKTLISLVHPSQ